MKKAIVYDKWLDSLGGGEVVACHIAKILLNKGFDVTMVGGKKFDVSKIKQKLNIDLSGAKFEWVWNDEQSLKIISKGADVFFNTTFMDYCHGFGKKSFYYTHFPSPAYLSMKGMIFNYLLVPVFSRFVNRVEFVSEKNEIIINNRYGYLLQGKNHILFTHEKKASRIVSFSIFYENHYDQIVKNTKIQFDNAHVVRRDLRVDPHHNIIHFKYHIEAQSDTVGLHIEIEPPQKVPHQYPPDRFILLFPKTLPGHILDKFMKRVLSKFETRMRAGIFVNVFKRLDSYTKIIANSTFTSRWITKYWSRNSLVIYPPVTFVNRDTSIKKKNMICSVGRFFTLGHGKKQEIMIEAFKQLYDMGYKDWELHLVGSVATNETASFAFVQKLKKAAHGYPIHFHLNADRKKMEKIANQSKLYWHATGYGEHEESDPVKFEHFGIAPIEAISAGCIPLLYEGGGLPEIIRTLNLSKLHLYTTIDELVQKSIHIIENKHAFKEEKVMQLLEKNFSIEAFEKKISKLIQ